MEEFFSLGDGQSSAVFSTDELSMHAKGGTELMKDLLHKHVSKELLEQVHIIPSRVRQIHPTKPNILWLHDTWNDPEAAHLASPASRDRFAALVFVSHHQFTTYHHHLRVPYEKAWLLRNAIEPIDLCEKPRDRVNLIYHTTPHRGLELLVPVFVHLYEMFGDRIHLDVYSSFSIYGWADRDAPYEPVFETCRIHPGITYHGARPNAEVREALKRAHIFAYPSIWPETSCIAALEAMSAGCAVVCSNLGALPETCGPFALMYRYCQDHEEHANRFAQQLYSAIQMQLTDPAAVLPMVGYVKQYVDLFYGWEVRKREWEIALSEIVKQHKGVQNVRGPGKQDA